VAPALSKSQENRQLHRYTHTDTRTHTYTQTHVDRDAVWAAALGFMQHFLCTVSFYLLSSRSSKIFCCVVAAVKITVKNKC